MLYKRTYRKRVYKRRKKPTLAPSTKKAVSTLVKRQIKRAEETKIYSTGSATSSALSSSNIYTLGPTQLISQGTNNNQRIGNDIFLTGMKLMFLFQNTNRQTLFFRVSVVWHIDQWNANWTYQSALNSNELYYTGSNPMQVPFNTKNTGTVVLFDRVYNMSATENNGATPFYKQKNFSTYIRINKRLTYLSGSALFKSKQLYVVVTPLSIDSGVVQGVTSVGAIDMQALLYYKDA